MDKPLYQVESLDCLATTIAEIRSLRQGFITNFFLDAAKHGLWISKGVCFAERINSTVFIVKRFDLFWNVFFCSTTLNQLRCDLKRFQMNHGGQSMVFDIVGREEQCLPIVAALQESQGKVITSLVRMIRLAEPFDYIPDPSIRKATEEDIPRVSQFLHSFFDARTEQIPYDEELKNFVLEGHVLLCKDDDEETGFLIYEQNNTTLYLRYWFTHPDYRDRKVGSRLLRRFFEEGKATKRQLLWVIRSNENAIKRYRHYGFEEENMYDYVLQFN